MAEYMAGKVATMPTAIARWWCAEMRKFGVFQIGGEFYACITDARIAPARSCQGRIMKRVLEPVASDKTTRTQQYDEAESHIVCPWHGYEFSIKTGFHQATAGCGCAGRANDPERRNLCQRLNPTAGTISMAGSIP